MGVRVVRPLHPDRCVIPGGKGRNVFGSGIPRSPSLGMFMPRRRRSLLGGSPRLHHRVYCIELHPAVRRQARFRRQNPHARYDATCLYVGSTGLDPEARFENHLRGHKGCPLVRTYGVRLRPDLFADFPAMTWEDAVATEAAYAQELRELRYAVYQH